MAKLDLRPPEPPEEKKPRSKKRHTGPKWPWELLFQLYMSGMDPKQLLEIPEAKGMSILYLRKKMQEESWAEKRRMQLAVLRGQVGKSMDETIKEQIERHYRFMVKQIEDEREIIARRLKTTDLPSQKERLALLEKYAQIAAKTLGLENETPTDQNKNGYNILIAVQDTRAAQDWMAKNFHEMKIAGSPRLASGQSATMTLPDKENAHTGRISSGQQLRANESGDENTGDAGKTTAERTAELIANDITPGDLGRRAGRTSGQAAGISPVIDVTPQAILEDYRKNKAA